MDFPETRIVERELKRFGQDPAMALAVLLKTLGDDHLASKPHAPEPSDEDEPEPFTALEVVHEILKREVDKNGALFQRHLRPGMPEDSVQGAAKVAGDLMMVQDVLRDMVAGCLDALDSYDADAREQAT